MWFPRSLSSWKCCQECDHVLLLSLSIFVAWRSYSGTREATIIVIDSLNSVVTKAFRIFFTDDPIDDRGKSSSNPNPIFLVVWEGIHLQVEFFHLYFQPQALDVIQESVEVFSDACEEHFRFHMLSRLSLASSALTRSKVLTNSLVWWRISGICVTELEENLKSQSTEAQVPDFICRMLWATLSTSSGRHL